MSCHRIILVVILVVLFLLFVYWIYSLIKKESYKSTSSQSENDVYINGNLNPSDSFGIQIQL
jgi:uncharacterized membrane protein SpoIIM required for sporulation